MSERELFILSLSILFPLLVAIARWHSTWLKFWPVIILFFLGFIGEYGVWIAMQESYNWQSVNNLYILADSLLIPIQFTVWGFLSVRFLIVGLLLPLFAAWIYFHTWSGSLAQINAYYRITYSFMLLLIGISSVNYLIIHTRSNLYRQPVFLFLAGYLVFYSYQLLYEAAYAFSLIRDEYWSILLNRIFALINFGCNILYGIAVCCIPVDPVRRWKQL